MPSRCFFEFERRIPVYYSGETIQGRITLTTTSQKSCREVYIECKGEAKVRWRRRRDSRTEDSRTEIYKGEETYISTHQTLHQGCQLLPGTYNYNFHITLPMNAPSSCVGKYGHIKYEISLIIDRPFRFNNVFRMPLTVLSHFNLNLIPELSIPLQAEYIKYVCCWPFNSDTIISTLTIPFGGYAPGQNIPYTLHIDNQSSSYDMIGASLSLLQTYTFVATKSRRKSRSVTAKIAQINQQETVLRLTKRILKGALYVPSAPPSSQTPGIITVNYHIEMTVKTSGCNKDSKIVMPIKLGTIPLYQTITPNSPARQPPSYDDIVPPYYERTSSVSENFVDTDIDPRNRVDGFLPHYPMYTNFILPTR